MGIDEINLLLERWNECPPIDETAFAYVGGWEDKSAPVAPGGRTPPDPRSSSRPGAPRESAVTPQMVAAELKAPNCGPLPPDVKAIFNSLRNELKERKHHG